ncbi:adenylate/guanylate cyclase domain-containing protein [Aristophania vespae]|uniref:adenylate/guanylate cyclase domain-containing protein n=1 Tax=Aristophania vespae TaxID=2697033 RepID=UPI00235141B7|nr:adenylate/guanylate cyclase domain-containing protein [Aristophania vespae]
MSSPSNRRWQIAQFLAPIFGVVLVIGAIILVSLHNYHSTREGAIQLSRSLLNSEQRYITQEVSNYLSPARSSSVVAKDLLNGPDIDKDVINFMLLGRSVLKNVPQVASFYLADDEGHFWMMAPRDGNYEETTYKIENGQHVFHHEVRDSEGRFVSEDDLKTDPYDPRGQNWYLGALKKEQQPGKLSLFWRDPVPYLSTNQFIITASTTFKTIDGRRMVFAINIALNQLSHFVNSLKIGKNGQAVIVDVGGHIIAGHNMEAMRAAKFDTTKVKLDPATQSVFIRALNIFKIQGPGTGLVHIKDQNYVTIASAMALAKKSWVLLINAPESDFANFAQIVQKQNIYFSLIVIVLSLLLAVGFIYQGRRVVFFQKRLKKGQKKIREESAGLLAIANTPSLLNPEKEIPAMTEVLAERAKAKRTSLWRLLPDGQRLLCEDMFDRAEDIHGSGIELAKHSHPALFECLRDSQLIDVPNAEEDDRFRSVQRVVMRTIDSSHLLFVPILDQHNPVGAIMIEDPEDHNMLERTIALVSSIEAVRFTERNKRFNKNNYKEQKSFEEASASHEANILKIDKGFLLDPKDQEDGLPQDGLYPLVPLMVLEFVESYTTQKDTAQRNLDLINDLSKQIQNAAKDAGLFSMQVAGNRLNLLGSCSQELDIGSVLRLADAAVNIREICLNALAGLSTRLMFRIGIDVGPVIAAQIGENPSVFNVWGDALSVADLMAHNAPDGGQIQVSEQAYRLLREYFLFRPRGDFYLPNKGITRSYIMAGRR